MPLSTDTSGPRKVIYEVICTYKIKADSDADAGRVAAHIARSLSRTGVIRHSGPDGIADLLTTNTRRK